MPLTDVATRCGLTRHLRVVFLYNSDGSGTTETLDISLQINFDLSSIHVKHMWLLYFEFAKYIPLCYRFLIGIMYISLISCKFYWNLVYFIGILSIVLVSCVFYWYSVNFIGILSMLLVSCIFYWYYPVNLIGIPSILFVSCILIGILYILLVSCMSYRYPVYFIGIMYILLVSCKLYGIL